MKFILDKYAKKPERSHPTDAGCDLFNKTNDVSIVMPHSSAVIDTGVHIELPEGTYGDVRSKSGLWFKFGLFCTGTIDEGYTGSIKVCIYNTKDTPYVFEKGEKVAQLVVVPCLYVDFEGVDSLEETDRGQNGFGSTGNGIQEV